MFSITTHRLELVAGTVTLLEAELSNHNLLAELLAARIPADWPPLLNDDSTIKWCSRYLKTHPEATGWANWYFILREDAVADRVAIGVGGFGGQPASDGTVEIGYSILEQFQNRGYATEAVYALIQWAFSHPQLRRITAATLPTLRNSLRVLEKTGFQFVGNRPNQDVIRFELKR